MKTFDEVVETLISGGQDAKEFVLKSKSTVEAIGSNKHTVKLLAEALSAGVVQAVDKGLGADAALLAGIVKVFQLGLAIGIEMEKRDTL